METEEASPQLPMDFKQVLGKLSAFPPRHLAKAGWPI